MILEKYLEYELHKLLVSQFHLKKFIYLILYKKVISSEYDKLLNETSEKIEFE